MVLPRPVAEHAARSVTWQRTSAGALGVAAALTVWLLLDGAMHGIRQPAFGGGSSRTLDAGTVAVASLLGGLLGWGTLLLAQRARRSARVKWLALVSAGRVVSLAGPFSGTGISAGDRLALATLHAAVAAVVIPLLHRTSPAAESADR